MLNSFELNFDLLGKQNSNRIICASIIDLNELNLKSSLGLIIANQKLQNEKSKISQAVFKF